MEPNAGSHHYLDVFGLTSQSSCAYSELREDWIVAGSTVHADRMPRLMLPVDGSFCRICIISKTSNVRL